MGDGGGEQFCWRMGFVVGESPTCYDGTPTAKIVPLARGTRGTDSNSNYPNKVVMNLS